MSVNVKVVTSQWWRHVFFATFEVFNMNIFYNVFERAHQGELKPEQILSISQKLIEDITRWREDMNFMFSWQEEYLTSSLRSLVRYCSCHENIKFISSRHRVMFFLLYGETNSTKAKGGNRDFIERYDTHKGDIRNIRHSGPGWSGVWNLRVFSSQ